MILSSQCFAQQIAPIVIRHYTIDIPIPMSLTILVPFISFIKLTFPFKLFICSYSLYAHKSISLQKLFLFNLNLIKIFCLSVYKVNYYVTLHL
jgi:hypothetical protein